MTSATGLDQRVAPAGNLESGILQRGAQLGQVRLELRFPGLPERSAAGPCQLVPASCERMLRVSSSTDPASRSNTPRRVASCSSSPPMTAISTISL
jgi:hypothetical protein